MQATCITTVQSCSANQPNHTHKNSGKSGNSSSLSYTPLFDHMLTHATLRHATTNTSTRLRGSSHETATPATWMRATHTPHHQTGKRSTSSNGSHGQGHGQAPQLQTAHKQLKIQKKHGACQQPMNSSIWQMALEGASKTPPTLSSSSPNTRYRQTVGKMSRTGNFYAWSDRKRQNPTKCDSR